MIAIIDYGVGNIGSITNAVSHLGFDVKLTNDEKTILEADKVILPGVGSFNEAMDKILKLNLDKTIYKLIELNKVIIGICVGMQVLCEGSYENGYHKGLGIFKGNLKKFDDSNLKVPEMGYNKIHIENDEILKEFDNKYFYFIHSYYLDINDDTIAYTDYGIKYSAILKKNNCYAIQFHPEKSSSDGLLLLRRLLEK